MNEEIGFLQACLSSPSNEAVRLVFSDWLEEQGDIRGKYLRLEIQIYHMMKQNKTITKKLIKDYLKIYGQIDRG